MEMRLKTMLHKARFVVLEAASQLPARHGSKGRVGKAQVVELVDTPS